MSTKEKESEVPTSTVDLDFERGDVVPITDGKILKIGIDVEAAAKDKALGLLTANHVAFDPNSAEAKRVLRMIDWRILPMVFTVYVLMLMGKSSLSFAAIIGIKTSAHLTTSEYE